MRNAMILAAGRGERMRPLTDHTPKPLLNVRGKPLICWHLDALAQAGFSLVTINISHLAKQISDALGDGSRWGLKIRYAAEPPGALETAGGIATARPWQDGEQRSADQEPFLVVNGDIYTDWDPKLADSLARDLIENQALCHLVLVPNPLQHPKGDFALMQSPGAVRANDARHAMTFSGIGVYMPEMFCAITPGTRAALAPLIHDMIAANRCRGSAHHGVWTDVGTPERLAQLNSSQAN